MAPRSNWKGFLRLSLLSIPVKSYTAVNPCNRRGITLNQLHEKCHNRIRYVKTCPEHGEVGNDEIVSGYEYSKGHYVVIDPDELETLRTEADQAVEIQAVVPATAVDPLYLSGKTSYLVPDGAVGQKPYALLQQALVDEGLVAVARVVLNGKEETILVRPMQRLLAITTVSYDDEVTPSATFDDELTKSTWTAAEMKLAQSLLGVMEQKTFDVGDYQDQYQQRLQTLVEAKAEGKELVRPKSTEKHPPIINLMDALKQSVKQAGVNPNSAAKPKAAGKTKKRPAIVKSVARKRKSA